MRGTTLGLDFRTRKFPVFHFQNATIPTSGGFYPVFLQEYKILSCIPAGIQDKKPLFMQEYLAWRAFLGTEITCFRQIWGTKITGFQVKVLYFVVLMTVHLVPKTHCIKPDAGVAGGNLNTATAGSAGSRR